MVQFADDLATYLQTSSIGTVGTDLFKGNAPDVPDNVVVLNDTGGLPNVLNEKGAAVELITVQILARNKRQEQARDKLLTIQALLHQLVNTDLGTFTIISARAFDRPSVIGKDVKERWQLVSNYEIRVRTS